MSFFGNILGGIGKIALPVVGGIFGGPLGAAAGGALGGLIGGGGAKGAISGAALGGVGGLAMGQGGGDGSGTDDGSGGGLSGILSGVGTFAKNNPGLLLGGASTLLGAQQASKAGGYQQQALDLAKQNYSDASPFRTAALSAMSAGAQPNGGHDLSFMSRGSNPYLPQHTASAPAVNPTALPGAMPGAMAGPMPGAPPRGGVLPRVGNGLPMALAGPVR